jgi:hypothetical protein
LNLKDQCGAERIEFAWLDKPYVPRAPAEPVHKTEYASRTARSKAKGANTGKKTPVRDYSNITAEQWKAIGAKWPLPNVLSVVDGTAAQTHLSFSPSAESNLVIDVYLDDASSIALRIVFLKTGNDLIEIEYPMHAVPAKVKLPKQGVSGHRAPLLQESKKAAAFWETFVGLVDACSRNASSKEKEQETGTSENDVMSLLPEPGTLDLTPLTVQDSEAIGSNWAQFEVIDRSRLRFGMDESFAEIDVLLAEGGKGFNIMIDVYSPDAGEATIREDYPMQAIPEKILPKGERVEGNPPTPEEIAAATSLWKEFIAHVRAYLKSDVTCDSISPPAAPNTVIHFPVAQNDFKVPSRMEMFIAIREYIDTYTPREDLFDVAIGLTEVADDILCEVDDG